jgi:hypothetical protein
MNLRRHFILVFAAVGIVLAFIQRLVFHLLVPYANNGTMLLPAVTITAARIYSAQLIAPALFLPALGAGLWLTLGTPGPQWTRKGWPYAIGVYFLLHLPLAYLSGSPFWLSSLFGRWTFLFYFGLSSLGFACAVWILSGRLHLAFLLIVFLPVLSFHLLRQIPVSFRWGFTWLPTVLVLALAGWWLRDAADRFDSAASEVG